MNKKELTNMQKPVIVSRGVIIYPGMKHAISVGRIKTIKAID